MLRFVWHKYPDLRFCQLLLNTLSNEWDLYYLEDEEFLKCFEQKYLGTNYEDKNT